MALLEIGNHVDALPEFQAAQGIDPTQGRFVRYLPAEIDFYLNNLLVSDSEYFSIAKA